MIENRDETIIQSTSEKVWEGLTNLNKHAEWTPLINFAEDKIEMGEKYDCQQKLALLISAIIVL